MECEICSFLNIVWAFIFSSDVPIQAADAGLCTILEGHHFPSRGHSLTSQCCMYARVQLLDSVPWPKSPHYLRKKCFSGFQLVCKLQFGSWWKFSLDLVTFKLNAGSWPLVIAFCHVFCSARGRLVSPRGV